MMEDNEQHMPAFAPHSEAVSAELAWHDEHGESMGYVATAGHVDVAGNDGSPLTSMFSVSYVATEVSGEGLAPAGPERPVTFLFNGGPGSSSVWLNTGGFGPRKAPSLAPAPTGPAPYAIADNPATLLKYSDLVFLDAPATGWSLMAEGVAPSRVWGVDEDADVFSRAVVAWLASSGRWNAPKYLFGESYGTTRAAVMARMIQNRCIDLNGVVLLSTMLDWTGDLEGSDKATIFRLPSYAAAARYHQGRADEVTRAFLREVEDFAQGELASAMFAGDGLGEAREHAVAKRMSDYIGVDADELVRRHLHLGMEDFRALLKGGEGKMIGRFDARFVADDDYVVGSGGADPATNDAATAGVNSAEVCAFRMAMDEIGYRWDRPYLVLNNMAVEPNWNWTHQAPAVDESMSCPNVALDLSSAMRRNPNLKVALMGGIYDLACPYFSARNDMAHLFLAERLKNNVSYGLYPTGHMAYVDAVALGQMDDDLRALYAEGRFSRR